MYVFILLKRIAVLALSIFILTSCASTTAKNKEEENDKDRMVKTAKINSQLGIAYLEKGNTQRAKQKLLLAMSQAPSIPEPWYSMGYYLETTGDKVEAKSYYLKALTLAPQRGDVNNNYGTFLCRIGSYQESIKHFIVATRDVSYLDVGSAYENAGLCASKIPNKELSIHYFELALKQDPTRQVSLYKLAELNYEKGHYAKAKEKLNELLMVTTPSMQTVALSMKIEKGQAAAAQKQINNISKVQAIAAKPAPLPAKLVLLKKDEKKLVTASKQISAAKKVALIKKKVDMVEVIKHTPETKKLASAAKVKNNKMLVSIKPLTKKKLAHHNSTNKRSIV